MQPDHAGKIRFEDIAVVHAAVQDVPGADIVVSNIDPDRRSQEERHADEQDRGERNECQNQRQALQGISVLISSGPPARVISARKRAGSIESLMNRTEPSAIEAKQPPG